MRDKAFRWLAGHQAVIICLLWGIWDAATAVAYLDGAPQQLQTAERLLHMPICGLPPPQCSSSER